MTENGVRQTPPPRPLNTVPEYAGFTRKLQETIAQLIGWKIWSSDDGALYATRVRALTPAERAADLSETIGADTPTGLADKLSEQMRKATAAAAKALSKDRDTGS